MKGNQEPMLYTTNAAVASLNHVPGFDPLKFLRRTASRKTGEDVMRLDLRYKKLWFRLACPTGRLKLNALRITEKMAIFEAKVYRDREDAEPLSSYVANCTLDATPGGLYVEAAQEEALDTALSNAGFGIQFADVGSESEEYGSEVPVGVKAEIAKPVQVKTEVAKSVQTKTEDAEPMGGGFGGDVPDELCYQWAREYFRDAEAKEDAEPEEKFVPKTYNGKMPKAGKVKKDKPKKAAPKPAPKPANEEQLTFGDFGTEEAAG